MVTVLAKTSMFVGGAMAILLDNTIPGKFCIRYTIAIANHSHSFEQSLYRLAVNLTYLLRDDKV